MLTSEKTLLQTISDLESRAFFDPEARERLNALYAEADPLVYLCLAQQARERERREREAWGPLYDIGLRFKSWVQEFFRNSGRAGAVGAPPGVSPQLLQQMMEGKVPPAGNA